MSDRDALLAAIIANPDDDTPRLVFADWLEERCEAEWANLIRWQVANSDESISALGPADGERKFRLVGGKKPVGTSRLARNWHAIIPGAAELRIRRGFVEYVRCSAACWLAHADAILAAHPVREVTLTTMPAYEWQQANLPPGWPLGIPFTGPRYVAEDALRHRWPTVKTWHLPNPEYDQWVRAGRLVADFGISAATVPMLDSPGMVAAPFTAAFRVRAPDQEAALNAPGVPRMGAVHGPFAVRRLDVTRRGDEYEIVAEYA